MAAENRADLATDTGTAVPDNTTAQITPSIIRGLLQKFIDSCCNLVDDLPALMDTNDDLGVTKTTIRDFTITRNAVIPGNLTLGTGAVLSKYIKASASLNFLSTAAGRTSDLTIALTGAAVGDIVNLGAPVASMTSNGHYFAFVSAADVVTVRFINNDNSAQDPAAGTFTVSIFK